MRQITPGRLAWKKFRSNPPAMAGAVFILLVAVVVILGHTIRPDDTANANDQQLSLARMKPGFSADMLRVKTDGTDIPSFFQAWIAGGTRHSYREFPVNSLALNGDSLTVILHSGTGAGEHMTFAKSEVLMHNAGSASIMDAYCFNRTYLLGTDKYGRDLLSRIMAGAAISLSVGLVAVFISLLVGLTIGLIAGYYRGWVDEVLMWFTNVVWSVPTLLMVMAITLIFGTGFWKIFLAVGLTMWVEVARIVRGQVLSVREKEYIEAARALGYKNPRIILKHVLPNVSGPVIVISAANFASAILIEAGLSFVGLGAQIPTPSWGNIIKEHYAYITTDMAYLAIAPGVCIMLLVLAFMLVGNGLRDALDSRKTV